MNDTKRRHIEIDQQQVGSYLRPEVRELLRRSGCVPRLTIEAEADMDPTEALKVLEARLNRASPSLPALQKLASMGQVGAGLSHEVRNILTGILGFAQAGKKRVHKPESALKVLALIEKEAQRCLQVLNGFLDLSRRGVDEIAPVDLADLGRAVETLALPQARVRKTKVLLELSDAPIIVQSNAGKLQQVLFNLVLNAIQAMPERTGGHVTLSTRAGDDGWVEIEVSDDGPGIPHSELPLIFEPFHTSKPAGVGTGLGLYVSREMVVALGGDLVAQSEEGHGATFTVRLPRRGPAAKDAGGEA